MARPRYRILLILCTMIITLTACRAPSDEPAQIDASLTPVPIARDVPDGTPEGNAVATNTAQAPVETPVATPTATPTSPPTVDSAATTAAAQPGTTPSPAPTATDAPPTQRAATATAPPPAPTASASPTGRPSPMAPSSPTSTESPTPTGSVLKRKESPPSGVAAQMGFFTPGPGLCGVDLAPGAKVEGGTVEVLSWVDFCFASFDPDRRLRLTWPGPDGTVVEQAVTLVSPGVGRFAWYPPPNITADPVTFTAAQEGAEGVAVFVLAPASEPRVVALTRAGAPGTTFPIAVAGFAAGQPLYLYGLDLDCREGLGCWTFLTQLPSPKVDAEGEAIYNLTTAAGDPPGVYAVVTDPVPGFLARNYPQAFAVEE